MEYENGNDHNFKKKINFNKILFGLLAVCVVLLITYQYYKNNEQNKALNIILDDVSSQLASIKNKINSVDINVSSIISATDSTSSTIDNLKSQLDILSSDVSDIQSSMAFR